MNDRLELELFRPRTSKPYLRVLSDDETTAQGWRAEVVYGRHDGLKLTENLFRLYWCGNATLEDIQAAHDAEQTLDNL